MVELCTPRRSVVKSLVIGTFFLIACRPSPAAAQVIEIYPGTNIQAVVNANPVGSAFRLKAGVHRMQTIRPRDGDWIGGEPGAILSGARQLTTITRSGSYWVASGQTQQGQVTGSIE